MSIALTPGVRRTTLITLVLLVCGCLPAVCPSGMPFGAPVAARASETVALHTSFTPDKLGA